MPARLILFGTKLVKTLSATSPHDLRNARAVRDCVRTAPVGNSSKKEEKRCSCEVQV